MEVWEAMDVWYPNRQNRYESPHWRHNHDKDQLYRVQAQTADPGGSKHNYQAIAPLTERLQYNTNPTGSGQEQESRYNSYAGMQSWEIPTNTCGPTGQPPYAMPAEPAKPETGACNGTVESGSAPPKRKICIRKWYVDVESTSHEPWNQQCGRKPQGCLTSLPSVPPWVSVPFLPGVSPYQYKGTVPQIPAFPAAHHQWASEQWWPVDVSTIAAVPRPLALHAGRHPALARSLVLNLTPLVTYIFSIISLFFLLWFAVCCALWLVMMSGLFHNWR